MALDGVRVLLFDWGGTIARVARQRFAWSACVQAGVWALHAAGRQVAAPAADDLVEVFTAAMAGPDRSASLREFDTTRMLAAWAGRHDVRLPAGVDLERLVDAFWRPWIGCLDVIGQAVETLRRLADAYCLGLVSNCAASPAVCHAEAERQGIAPSLAFLLVSSELGLRKPHPEVYRRAMGLAAARLPGIQAGQVAFIGDTPAADVDGPAGFGMATVLVRTGTWDGNSAALSRRPSIIIDSIDDLPAVLHRSAGART